MAQIKHNHFLDTVDQVFTYAKQLNILHLKASGTNFTGRTIQINTKDLYHFGTTGYLGLEQDPRLKEAAIEAINRFGTQFPLSKSYIAHPLYDEIEKLLEQMYGRQVIVTKNATLAHMAAIPVLVGDKDAVLLDHQVHWSVQDAAKRLKLRGVKIELVRHNRLDILEEKIRALSSSVENIWYMADGVYSMFGDFAPVKKLLDLSKKYKQLHLYFDDVHGMSWVGSHGCGFVMDKIGHLDPKTVVVGTLSKTFGANGSFILCGNQKHHLKIKTFGGSLTFSAQLDPASVGAAIASAKIHLSKEITEFQNELKEKITFFNDMISNYHLPLVEKNLSPVFFLATGIPETGYRLTRSLMNEGFFVNMGLFPAVPSKNTGLRITISRHNQKKEMEKLALTLHRLYPKVMHETGNNMERLRDAFKTDFKSINEQKQTADFKIVQHNSITEINRQSWNDLFQGEGILDWEGFKFLEDCFQNNTNEALEHNWKFFYIQIVNPKGTVLAWGAFTLSLWKDDLLAKPEISKEIEKQREKEKYFLTSKVLALGSLFSDGLSLFIKEGPEKEKALAALLKCLEEIAVEHNASQLVLRDFSSPNPYASFLQGQGFIPVNMPEVCMMHELRWNNLEEYKNLLSKKSKKHFEKDVEPFQELVIVKIKSNTTKEEIAHFYNLYLQVKNRNTELNMFAYPQSVLENMNQSEKWEFIVLYPKKKEVIEKAIGVMFCYRNHKTFVPSLVGLDYDLNSSYQTYRQLLFESIRRAKNEKFDKVDFGVSANFEKKKMGAVVIPKVAYMQANSNFIMDYLEIQQ